MADHLTSNIIMINKVLARLEIAGNTSIQWVRKFPPTVHDQSLVALVAGVRDRDFETLHNYGRRGLVEF
jgi:hypothetical protein